MCSITLDIVKEAALSLIEKDNKVSSGYVTALLRRNKYSAHQKDVSKMMHQLYLEKILDFTVVHGRNHLYRLYRLHTKPNTTKKSHVVTTEKVLDNISSITKQNFNTLKLTDII